MARPSGDHAPRLSTRVVRITADGGPVGSPGDRGNRQPPDVGVESAHRERQAVPVRRGHGLDVVARPGGELLAGAGARPRRRRAALRHRLMPPPRSTGRSRSVGLADHAGSRSRPLSSAHAPVRAETRRPARRSRRVLLDAAGTRAPPIRRPAGPLDLRLARVRRDLPRIEAAARRPRSGGPGPGGVEGQPVPRATTTERRHLDDPARLARGDVHGPDVAALEIPAVDVGRLELPAVRRRADECEPPAVRRPGGLDVVAGGAREPALLAGREGPQEDLPVPPPPPRTAKRLPSGDQAGHSSTPSAEGELRQLAVEARRHVPAAAPRCSAPPPA